MSILDEIGKQIEKAKFTTTPKNVGKVIEVGDGVVRVSGLSDVSSSELVLFPLSGPDTHRAGGAVGDRKQRLGVRRRSYVGELYVGYRSVDEA